MTGSEADEDTGGGSSPAGAPASDPSPSGGGGGSKANKPTDEFADFVRSSYFVLILSMSIICGLLIIIFVTRYARRQYAKIQLDGKDFHPKNGKPKDLQEQIQLLLTKSVEEVSCDPPLLSESLHGEPLSAEQQHAYYYRMKALDQIHDLDDCIWRGCGEDGSLKRRPRSELKQYFNLLRSNNHKQQPAANAPLWGTQVEITKKFTTKYNHARFDPGPFTKEHYQQYSDTLVQLKNSIIQNQKQTPGASKSHRISSEKSTSSHAHPSIKAGTTPSNLNSSMSRSGAMRETANDRSSDRAPESRSMSAGGRAHHSGSAPNHSGGGGGGAPLENIPTSNDGSSDTDVTLEPSGGLSPTNESAA